MPSRACSSRSSRARTRTTRRGWSATRWGRIREAGVDDLVAPLRVEAHELPIAAGFFDAVVSVDAYHYFGTDDLYLGFGLSRFLAPGGRLGIVVPGLREEIDEVPAALRRHWQADFWSF